MKGDQRILEKRFKVECSFLLADLILGKACQNLCYLVTTCSNKAGAGAPQSLIAGAGHDGLTVWRSGKVQNLCERLRLTT